MRLAAESDRALGLHRLELCQRLGRGVENAFVRRERAGLFAKAGIGDGHIHHVAALEGAVLGERLLILRVALQHHFVLLLRRDAEAARDVFPGFYHGVFRVGVFVEVVQRP